MKQHKTSDAFDADCGIHIKNTVLITHNADK